MNRLVSAEYREMIGAGLAILPPNIADRLRHVHFLTGTDPGYAGLHAYGSGLDGRAYGSTAHCAWSFHTSDRSTTIVLPNLDTRGPITVVHELGHALHEVLDFAPEVPPITDYARTNRYEAFAEFFTAHLYWYGDQDAYHGDLRTRRLLDDLAEVAA